MIENPSLVHKHFTLLQEIDCITLHPERCENFGHMLNASRKNLSEVFFDFLTKKNFKDEKLCVIDGFLFVFNEPKYSTWHMLDWWDQRKLIQSIKEHPLYTGRAKDLLTRSKKAAYIDYSDKMVAKSTDKEIKRAWMLKRLVMKECFWNAIDSFSHAAYFNQKYKEMFPALSVLLCDVTDKNGTNSELLLCIDNGTGFLYKKKSRDSAMIRLFYKAYKKIFKKGVFYIGGLELGLIETESELSCHGSGAVVYQGWQQ
jgi:hypothetical protein